MPIQRLSTAPTKEFAVDRDSTEHSSRWRHTHNTHPRQVPHSRPPIQLHRIPTTPLTVSCKAALDLPSSSFSESQQWMWVERLITWHHLVLTHQTHILQHDQPQSSGFTVPDPLPSKVYYYNLLRDLAGINSRWSPIFTTLDNLPTLPGNPFPRYVYGLSFTPKFWYCTEQVH